MSKSYHRGQHSTCVAGARTYEHVYWASHGTLGNRDWPQWLQQHHRPCRHTGRTPRTARACLCARRPAVRRALKSHCGSNGPTIVATGQHRAQQSLKWRAPSSVYVQHYIAVVKSQTKRTALFGLPEPRGEWFFCHTFKAGQQPHRESRRAEEELK